jgi:hypothetical protein
MTTSGERNAIEFRFSNFIANFVALSTSASRWATRRFPPPWFVEEQPACFVVRDVNGEVLAYVYCGETAAKLLSKDEARRIAQNMV